jgi:hypothetical protein
MAVGGGERMPRVLWCLTIAHWIVAATSLNQSTTASKIASCSSEHWPVQIILKFIVLCVYTGDETGYNNETRWLRQVTAYVLRRRSWRMMIPATKRFITLHMLFSV